VKTALLDVNLLIALHWPAHEHHEAAHRWYAGQRARRWASCPLSELAFVRILSNPALSRDALSPAQALDLLSAGLAHPAHEFWPDETPVPSALEHSAGSLQGHQQLTDAYLMALAERRKGVLATFDAGLRMLAGQRFKSVVHCVPTR
jgi:hypothetical protein